MQCMGDRFSPAFAPEAGTPAEPVAKKHRGGELSPPRLSSRLPLTA